MDRPFDFSRTIKRDASLRQNNKCAHCGDNLTDLLDHAHHVVPNQTGNPATRQDNWLRSLENCVVLCDTCHTRVHQDGRFRAGAVAPPDYFPYSHGGQAAEHRSWALRMNRRFWK